MLVIGMGEEKTPLAFRKSCEKFILLDVLNKSSDKKQQSDKKIDKKVDKKSEKTEKPKKTAKKVKEQAEEVIAENQNEKAEQIISDDIEEKSTDTPTLMPLESITQLIKTEILPELADEDGWASLADIGNWLYKLYSDFDSRNYGFSKLSALFKSCEDFEVKPQPQTDPNSNIIYYLIKEKTNV